MPSPAFHGKFKLALGWALPFSRRPTWGDMLKE